MAVTNVYVDVNAATLSGSRVTSSTSNNTRPWQKFVIGDNKDLNLYFVDGAGAYVDVTAYSDVRVGVGGINKRPTAGTFTLTGGLGTQTIPFDSNAATMDTLITAAQAACSVITPVAGVWVVKFDAAGAQSLPTTDAALLTPDCSVSVKRLVTGDGSTKEEWIIRLFQTPWAYSDSWSAITNGRTGSLNFGTENLYVAMGSLDSVSGYFEIELTDASANITTVIQAPVVVVGPVVGDGASGSGAFELAIPKETLIMAVTGEDDTLTTGTGKVTWQMPFAMTATGIKASVKTAPVGSTIIVDLNEAGSTVLSTKLSIDAGETSSATAATPPVFSDTALADNAIMTVDVDQVGSGTAGVGLKLYLTGVRV
jgi:hypothetical protein